MEGWEGMRNNLHGASEIEVTYQINKAKRPPVRFSVELFLIHIYIHNPSYPYNIIPSITPSTTISIIPQLFICPSAHLPIAPPPIARGRQVNGSSNTIQYNTKQQGLNNHPHDPKHSCTLLYVPPLFIYNPKYTHLSQ